MKKIGAVVSLLFLCSLTLITVVHPVRGRESATGEELALKTFLPIVGSNANTLPPLFGVQTYGSTTSSAEYTPFLLQTNANWVRAPIRWEWAEPINTEPANFRWSEVDSTLAIAVQGAPRLIATIDYSPEWAADFPHSPIYAEALPEFAQFVGALVERYDGDGLEDAPGNPIVTYWEFFNEPDGSITNWIPAWGESGAQYAEMLKTVYPAVKQASSNAKVVFGGVAYDWWQNVGGPFVETFVDDVLTAGGGAYFDVMNFHAYPSFSVNWTDDGSSGLYEKAQAIRTKLQDYQLNKPLIITEAGWHSSNELLAPSTPENQARYVPELFVESIAADLDVMIWWMLYDPGDFYYANGLVTKAPDPIIKPSFTAYQTMVAQLGKADFVQRLATPAPVVNTDGTVQSMDAYEFRDRATQHTIYVAWMNPVDGGVTWPLRLPAAQGTVHNLYGTTSVPVLDTDDGVADGFITIAVSSQPLYVEVP